MAEGIITQNNFQGYEHHDDITTQNPNTLAYGSHDVLIVGNTNNAVESRNGYTILGESNQGSFVTPIRSKYDKYVNNSGVSFAVREYEIPSGSQAGQSCVEVFITIIGIEYLKMVFLGFMNHILHHGQILTHL